MKRFIVSQNYDIIWGVADDTIISRWGNTICIVGYPIGEDGYGEADIVEEHERLEGEKMNKHLVELGYYTDNDRARLVMILLTRWLKGLDGDIPVFIMPEYNQYVSFDGNGELTYHDEDPLDSFGEPDENEYER